MQNEGAFIHLNAIVEKGARIGPGSRVWAFAHVLAGAVIGAECNVCDHTFIENDVVIGDRVTLKCGVFLWDGLRLGDDVFVGPNVTFTNDKFPRSRHRPESYLQTIIENGASIGANATILPGLRIGSKAMVGSGAVVTRDVPPNAIVFGNPAQIVGYSDTATHEMSNLESSIDAAPSKLRGVTLHTLNHVEDIRGDLCAADWQKDVPFEPKRVFCVYNVPSVRVRGEHAHKECHQFLVCVHGALSVVLDDGHSRAEYRLDRPWIGLHVPPRIWGIQYKYTPDAVLMVLASHEYDPDDYIRDYADFLKTRGT
jgi:UDP-2-acetamido-3-amino-2,3-dideoxy-glucuronate N-acetyltransferase